MLVVVLGHRPDRRGRAKTDYYVQDWTSVPLSTGTAGTEVGSGRRRTVLSIWHPLQLLRPHAPAPEGVVGMTVALWGVQAHKYFEEDVQRQILVRQAFAVPHGHLNVFRGHPAGSTGGWLTVLPPADGRVPEELAAGYGQLVRWWEAQRALPHKTMEAREGKGVPPASGQPGEQRGPTLELGQQQQQAGGKRQWQHVQQEQPEQRVSEKNEDEEKKAKEEKTRKRKKGGESRKELELRELAAGEEAGHVWVNAEGKRLWRFSGL